MDLRGLCSHFVRRDHKPMFFQTVHNVILHNKKKEEHIQVKCSAIYNGAATACK